jgi:hypothetical protein
MAHNEPQMPVRERYVSASFEPSLRTAPEESARAHDRSLSGVLRTPLRSYLVQPSDPGGPSPFDRPGAA